MLTTLLLPTGGAATVAGHDVVARGAGGARLDRRRPAGSGARPADDRPRADPAAGDPAGDRRPPRAGAAPTTCSSGSTSSDAADRRVGTYSGGMQRRLDLAAALVHEPRVLFLDEPTTGLDPVSRKTIWEEVRALNDAGTTVFLTTQYLEEADQLADDVAIIDERPDRRRRHAGLAEGGSRQPPRPAPPRRRPGRRGRGDSRRASAGCCPRATANASRSRSRAAPPTSPASSARSTRPGSRSSRWSWSSRPSTTSSSPRPATTCRAARRRPSSRRRSHERARRQRPRRPRAGDALGPPDLPPAAADRADHRLPHPAAGDPDRRRQRGRCSCPASPKSQSFLQFMLAGAMMQSLMIAGNSGGIALAVDIEMGFTDRLFAAPIPRFAIVLGRLAGTGGARASSPRSGSSRSGSSSAPRSRPASPARCWRSSSSPRRRWRSAGSAPRSRCAPAAPASSRACSRSSSSSSSSPPPSSPRN